jgi:hypothetical protein
MSSAPLTSNYQCFWDFVHSRKILPATLPTIRGEFVSSLGGLIRSLPRRLSQKTSLGAFFACLPMPKSDAIKLAARFRPKCESNGICEILQHLG